MTRVFAGLILVALAAPAAAELPDGHWRLSQHFSPTADQRMFVLKVETKDGKATATVTDSLKQIMAKGQEPKPIDVKVTEFKVDGSKVTLNADVGAQKLVFEGTLNTKGSKTVYGSIDNGRAVMRGSLTMQDGEKLVGRTAAEQPKIPEPYQAANKLTTSVLNLRVQAQRATDQNDRADLMAKMKAAQAEADEKMPPLFKETVEKHADSPFAVEAATQLLRSAAKNKATAADVVAWVKVISSDAAKYGTRFASDTSIQVAETLNTQKGFELIALGAATKGAAGLTEKSPLTVQSRYLTALKATQISNQMDQDAKTTDIRLVKVEAALDAEYVKTVPPFKPEKFGGRKDKAANRVAVMELFTGATCPPCRAADAAFDALEKAYDAKDLILIQYHMHIPGPDPMTNPDTIARWDYYREKFPMGIRGVPSSIFNGKPQAGGGGDMENAEPKFKQYQGIINETLEQKTDVKVTGSAKRTGDKINVAVELSGVSDPGDKVRLRVLVVEEKVKYVGSNRMRFHHQVVRAMPGGATGMPVTEKGMKRTLDVDVAEVRKTLASYLDKFAADRPFANPDRPLELAHLKVIAFVQDDATGEILNAAEFEIDGK